MRGRRRSGSCLITIIAVLLVVTVVVMILIASGVFDKIERKTNTVIYPLKYKAEILEASEKYNLPPEFICAVIYTESKFDEKAESYVGAQGLMQIIPDTFTWLQNLRGESDTEGLDVFDPKVNIDYGCYYISFLINGMEDVREGYKDPYTAMAAYNAGHVYVDEWLQNPEYSDDGVTLKEIPFEETRNYVQKIREVQVKYKELYFE